MATIGKGMENVLVEKKAATGEQDRTSLYGMQQLLKLLKVWCKSASALFILRQILVQPFLMGGITTLCCIP